MNLSICIPIYNYPIIKLVMDLAKQCEEEKIGYEINLMDDGSNEFKEGNRKVTLLRNVNYIELPVNIGRAAIRNRLTDLAQYDLLLLMDCDAGMVDNRFIHRYIEVVQANPSLEVVMGGLSYKKDIPPFNSYLRWFYGIHREEKPADRRNIHPYRAFTAFNCLIRKDVFQRIRFNDTLNGYGHEDTLFGWNLKKQKISILHIDNPAFHLSYDTTDVYLKKLKTAERNLWLIYKNVDNPQSFSEDIKILKCFIKLQKLHLVKLFSWWFGKFRKLIVNNLMSENPNLSVLDIYKLGELCCVSK